MTGKRLVVVGGGIAGLAAAWSARREWQTGTDAGELEILVLERETAVGGKVRSLRQGEWLVEAGPTGFLSGRPDLTRLIEETGLAAETVPANPAAARRFVVRHGRLREIPLHPLRFARSGLLSPAGLLRLLGEPFVSKRTGGHEETVWQFAARRLGQQVADRLVSPMALGVFAGDARQLSLQAAFPRMAALESEYGSLLKAVAARRGSTSSGTLTSFRDGLQILPQTIVERGSFQVRCGTTVTDLLPTPSGWRVVTENGGEPIPADAILVCCEAPAAARLLERLAPEAATALRKIPCPPVAVVALGYPASSCPGVPAGFGALVARGEGYRMLGNLWDTYLYPGRSPDGSVLIRAMYGGAVDPGVGGLDEGDLLALAIEEVGRLYGISHPPTYRRVIRWPQAIPQYLLGHLDRVRTIEEDVGRRPGLAVAGNALHGIAFADAAASGTRAGERVARWLRRSG